MAPRIQTRLMAALHGYTTESVLASQLLPGRSKQIVAAITHSTETLPRVRYVVRQGDTITLTTEHLAEAVAHYSEED
jgi:hypothetical protein